ncbi:hypothetical protein PRUB_a2928 [Pseudoalteromonas rubra]|uniref:Uncharacterized protein n=1 Tax=Pseudoalteromonas rubra TaxID=43658 RepID=A0A8T0CC77_9GAMM|nr:hypothetical protein PRUB_a2928 [Pseudoalteromonas rubra]
MKYIIYRKQFPNLNGHSFNEKILRKKCGLISEEEKSLREVSADRLLVRDYVETLKSNVELIPLLWSGKVLMKEDWESLPDKFVIKARHGSQMVLIVDKKIHSYEFVLKKTEQWKKNDYYLLGREWVYKNTPRELVVEEFITFESDVPPDYKFFCLNGRVELVQVDLDRFSSHSRNLYNRHFELLDVKFKYEQGEKIAKPNLFDEAVEIATNLSKDFDFIRVDLYVLDDKVYFGELTNFPENGLGCFSPQSFDQELGAKLELNHVK